MSKKYISPERLAQYDEKIKDVIDNAVTELQNGAVKANTDNIAENTQAIADIQAAMPTPITNAKIDELFATV